MLSSVASFSRRIAWLGASLKAYCPHHLLASSETDVTADISLGTSMETAVNVMSK